VRLPMIIVSVVMAGCLLIKEQSALSAHTDACSTLTENAAYLRISQARGVITPSVMYEGAGEIPELLQAYRCLAASSDAIGKLERILANGSVSGQLLALAALHDLDPNRFQRLALPYRSSADSVPLLARDVARSIPVTAVLRMIEEGKYSALLSSAEQRGGFRRPAPAPPRPR
jgi:hypothetical protein